MDNSTFDLLTKSRAGTIDAKVDVVSDDDAVFSLELLTKLKGVSQTWRDQLIDDWDVFLGAQVTQGQDALNKKRKQKSYTVDVIFQAVEQAIALLTANRPRFSATGQEDSDTRIAALYSLIMQFIWYINRGTQKLKHIIKDYYVGAVGWMLVAWDPLMANGKGDIRLETIDPRRVYVDDTAKDFFWQDAGHIIIESFLTAEMMQTEYNIPLEELAKFESTQEDTQSSTRVSEIDSGSANRAFSGTSVYQRLDRFSRVKEQMVLLTKGNERFEMLLPKEGIMQRLTKMPAMVSRSNGVTNYFVHPRNVANVMNLLNQYGPVFHQVVDVNGQQDIMKGEENSVEYPEGVSPIPNSTTYLVKSNVREAIYRGEVDVKFTFTDRILHIASIGKKVLFHKVCPTSHYPIIPLINNFDRTIYPVGDTRRVKREQEFINSIRQLEVTHATVTTNYKIGYPDGRYTEKKLNEIFNDPSQRFIPYDAEMSSSGLQVIAPPPLPNHFYQLEDRARRNIEERLGIFAMMQGSPQDAPSTYKATVALDEYGQRRIKSKRDDIEEFLNQIGKVVVDYVQFYYTDERVISIAEPNDKPKTVHLTTDSSFDNLYNQNQYRINDMTVGHFDIMVISGSTLPSNRFALLELYTDLYREGLLDQQTVLEKTEVANVEEVMGRISLIKKQQEQIANLEAQIKKLSGDLQTADREVVHARREVEQTKFQRDLDVESAKATAARMIYESNLKAKARALPSLVGE